MAHMHAILLLLCVVLHANPYRSIEITCFHINPVLPYIYNRQPAPAFKALYSIGLWPVRSGPNPNLLGLIGVGCAFTKNGEHISSEKIHFIPFMNSKILLLAIIFMVHSH